MNYEDAATNLQSGDRLLTPVTAGKSTVIPVEVLKEWDAKLDTMELLFDACVELDEGCEEQLATVRKLRQQIRELVPFENVPIITDNEEVSSK